MPTTYMNPGQNNPYSWYTYNNFTTHSNTKTHVHEFTGTTYSQDGHQHEFTGTTEPAPNGVPHTHAYSAVTEFNNGHRHELRGNTGPAVAVSGGGHIHYLKGITYGYPSHQHEYETRTRKSVK